MADSIAFALRFSGRKRVHDADAFMAKTADNPHRVPLCDRAMMLLTMRRWPNGQGMEPDPNAYVWPERSGYRPVTGKSVYNVV